MRILSKTSIHEPVWGECEKCEFLNACGDGESCIVEVEDSKVGKVSTGIKGIYKMNGKYQVRLQKNNIRYYGGAFEKLEEAIKKKEELERGIAQC